MKHDHREVKDLFRKIEGAKGKQKNAVFNQIKKALQTHTRIEESIFYPAIEQKEELKDMVLESYEEHKQVKNFLSEMDTLVADSEKFEPKLKVLKENVEHHAEEEEEGKMFPKIRELFDDQYLKQLGQELAAAKGKRSRAA